MKKANFYLEIFLISLAAILLEVSYTRVFSFKLFYFYTYLIVGLALLGLGSGAVLVSIQPRLREARVADVLASGCTLGGALVGLGYFLVAMVEVNTIRFWADLTQPLRIVGISAGLFAVYLLVGVMIAKLFASRPESINRLYAADLVGAALGAGLAVSLMRLISPPGCVFLSGAVLGAAGFRQAGKRSRGHLAAAVAVVMLLFVGVGLPRVLPDPVPDQLKSLYPGRDWIMLSKWDPVFRIDVTPSPLHDVLIINHDALLGSTLHRFEGDISEMTKFEADSRALPFAIAGDAENVLIIGAAGGHEVLASLYFGVDHVTAVELNPATVSLVREDFADYTGHFYLRPDVDYINAEGRSFLAGRDEHYDVVFFTAPDSYAAMNAASAGAYVLTESYLYTVAMIELSVGHLTDDGIICMQFGEVAYTEKPNRTARYVATAREAFRRLGIDRFEDHVMVASGSGRLEATTILLKRSPFTEAEIDRFLTTAGKIANNDPRYAPGRRLHEGPVTEIITRPDEELDTYFRTYPYDVSPVLDDSPFFWHFVRFRDIIGSKDRKRLDFEDAVGERLLVFLLGLAIVYAAVFLLLPFFFIRRTWLSLPFKRRTAVYFAAIGTGFMFFEIVLIQKLTLLLGYPTYSLSVTLASLLVFTGIGSLATVRYMSRYRSAMLVLTVVVLASTLFYQFAMDPLVDAMLARPLPVRAGLAVVMILPLGLCLGGFMPVGLAVAAAHTVHKEQYVAWGWAVNGFFSVISSIAATILSMTIGFSAVMYFGLGLYLVATAVLRGIPPARLS